MRKRSGKGFGTGAQSVYVQLIVEAQGRLEIFSLALPCKLLAYFLKLCNKDI